MIRKVYKTVTFLNIKHLNCCGASVSKATSPVHSDALFNSDTSTLQKTSNQHLEVVSRKVSNVIPPSTAGVSSQIFSKSIHTSYTNCSEKREKKDENLNNKMAPIDGSKNNGVKINQLDLNSNDPWDTKDLESKLEKLKEEHQIMMFSKSFCPFCTKVKDLLTSEVRLGEVIHDFTVLELDLIKDQEFAKSIQDTLLKMFGQKTVPNIFIGGKHVGGASDIMALQESSKLYSLLKESSKLEKKHEFDYDLIVIGGGSGGIAASREAASLGMSVACFDFVKPTPMGTKWGLGGTCVNVGCIPKKLMHQAGLVGESVRHDAPLYGWMSSQLTDSGEKDKQRIDVKHDWSGMVDNIQNHIGSLNWGYRVVLREQGVKYFNELASFDQNCENSHTIKTVDKKGKVKQVTGDKFIIAVGGRPKYPDIPGAKELGITSDDIFSLNKSPGKTLLIGASYIALECAGFLQSLGYDCTVMVRSILLRGFDQDMANRIGEYMEKRCGVKFVRECVPLSLNEESTEKNGERKIRVEAKYLNSSSPDDSNPVYSETFDTVVFAIGRDADTHSLNLSSKGVKLNEKNGKIIHNDVEQTTCSNIYAIGDVLDGKPELTPVAIKAGNRLAKRLSGISDVKTNYKAIPTTIFTPLEYSCCGLTEQEAEEIYGSDSVVVYHKNFWPTEWTVARREANDCYMKMICNVNDNLKVLGLHYLGPNAGEVMQGFGGMLLMGASKSHFDELVGIHPTNAEWFVDMNVKKGASGSDPSATGC